MISSGGSILDTSRQLKEKGAGRVFLCTTFGLFTDGLEAFDKAYEHGDFDRVVTTTLTYLPPEVVTREYFIEADMSKYMSFIIATLNHDHSLDSLLNPHARIQNLLTKYKAAQQEPQGE